MLASYRCFRGLFAPSEAARLMAHWGLGAGRSSKAPFGETDPPAHLEELDRVAWLEGTRYLRNQLLPDSDVMSMAAGLELRLPLVDAELQRQLAPIPAIERLSGKSLLRQAVPELPEWFSQRPKQGFRFPFQLWLDDPAAPLALRLPATPAGIDLEPWYRRWSLMVLENWLREHLGIDLPAPETSKWLA